MTRLAARHQAINLAQGFPNFPAPEAIKNAACAAIQADVNQYAVTWGGPAFRHAIAEKYRLFYGWEVDPETEITVACGATECMIASMLALVDPGDRVVVIEPFYENYHPDAILAGAEPVYVRMDPERGWAIDFDEMEEAVRRASETGRVRALILNSPHNPTGKVLGREELEKIAELACRYDFYVITDEIYEHIIYDGCRHLPIARLAGMSQRTVTISGMSKSYSLTGWRIGYVIAPPDLTNAIRKVHDFLTVGAAAPLQQAGVAAMEMPAGYYDRLAEDYRERRDFLLDVLEDVGFRVWKPSGAYYIMADFSALSDKDDLDFVRELIEKHRVAAVPGSSFHREPQSGRKYVRFAYCKTLELLEEAAANLAGLKQVLS